MNNNDQIRSQFCTCHDSWAVVSCAKLWPEWIIGILIIAKGIFARFHLSAHQVLVVWIPGILPWAAKFVAQHPRRMELSKKSMKLTWSIPTNDTIWQRLMDVRGNGRCQWSCTIWHKTNGQCWSNSLWSGYVIWWCCCWSTLIQVMACIAVTMPNDTCLMAPSHYLNHLTLRNKLQGNFKQNTKNFFQENASANIVFKMSNILFRPQPVNLLWPNDAI